jgi:hypothetical protein
LVHRRSLLPGRPWTRSFAARTPSTRDWAPYTSSNVTGELTSVPGATHHGWISVNGPPFSDILIASGLTTVNAVSFYPNVAAWAVLDPLSRQKDIWNRYANLVFRPQPGLAAPTLTLVQPDLIRIDFDPCGRALPSLGVGFVS